LALAVCGLPLLCSQVYAGEDLVVAPRTGIAERLETQRDAIMALPGVVGVGLSLCDDDPCITVLTHEPSPDLEQRLERLLGGHRYIIVPTGPIRAYPDSQ
jgi:hypothetical protein